MKQCPVCGAQLSDEAKFCSSCGAVITNENTNQNPNASQAVVVKPAVSYENVYDHTKEFDGADISENKIFAMLPYLLGLIGVIVSCLCAGKSKYVAFHIKQAVKLVIADVIIILVSSVLCWTIIVPIAGAVCVAVVFVLDIIQFFSVCKGNAKEVPIVRDFSFLK